MAEPADAPLPDELFGAAIDWYREMRRDLPWRRTRDPYEILVSEIMLQQTRVETVIGRYESFLRRFPSLAELAAAPLDDVLAEWSGLGYYRRPRALHALAQSVVEEHQGRLPENLEGLLALPGLGPYTAAAIGAIAFGVPALSVDGNVGRVLCRITALADDFRRAPIRRHLEAVAADAMRRHAPGELNQAIMELGARVCAPQAPRCDACPCAPWCKAHALGIEQLIPPTAKTAVTAVIECAAVIEHNDRYLLFRGQRPTLVADMWEFPTLDSRLVARSSKRALAARLAALGWNVALGAKLGEIRHGMTNRRITCRIYAGRLHGDRPPATTGGVAPAAPTPAEPASRRNEPPAATDAAAPTSRTPPKPTSRRAQPSAAITASPSPREAVVRDRNGDTDAIPEHGWFPLDTIARLPLAASARKTLEQLLHPPITAP